jgi:hypothetical protein
MGYKYIRQFGEFYLVDDQTEKLIRFKGEKVLGLAVTVIPDTQTFYFHKHGNYEMVKQWYDEARNKLSEVGPTGIEMARELRLVRVENCLLEDLNKILSTSGLPVSFLERLEVIDVTPT